MTKNLNTTEYWNDVYEKEHKGTVKLFFEKMNSFFYFRNYRAIFKKIINLIPDGSKVLDVGCGPGLLCRKLKMEKTHCEITSIDFSDYVIKMNQERDNGLDIKYIVYDVRDGLPFGKYKKFDFITMTEVLEHLEEPEKTIDSIFKLLKKNGYFIATVPEGDFLDKFMTMGGTIGEHVRHWTKEEIKVFLNKYSSDITISKPSLIQRWTLLVIAKNK
jgi:2-polyprenyl-3-methyl-5-hydroxy-6-metoxy-1,4-benzoquinol methylase